MMKTKNRKPVIPAQAGIQIMDPRLKHSGMTKIPTHALKILLVTLFIAGCTVKAVGDPNRPITINANVVVDIHGLKQTAANIEDMVAEGGAQ